MQYEAQPQPQPQAASGQYVGIGPRLVAVIIDGIILFIIEYILLTILGQNQAGLSYFIETVILVAYYTVMEATLGATVGKMVMGLRVVRQDGGPISWTESLIRNLLRLIDALPFAYIVGAIIMSTNPLKQRLGDKVAHTVVIRSR